MVMLSVTGNDRGLSLLGIFIVLALIAAAGLFIAKKAMFGLTAGDEVKLKAILLKKFEGELLKEGQKTVIEEADDRHFVFKRGNERGGFRFSGEQPSGHLEKLAAEDWESVFDNINNLQFSYTDIYNNSLQLWEAQERPDLIKKISVSILVHGEKEETDYYSQSGIDLDGNPNNGMAKANKVEFVVEISR